MDSKIARSVVAEWKDWAYCAGEEDVEQGGKEEMKERKLDSRFGRIRILGSMSCEIEIPGSVDGDISEGWDGDGRGGGGCVGRASCSEPSFE